MKIPFRMLPSTWHLTGAEYERAKIMYEHEGDDSTARDRALLNIDFTPGTVDYDLQSLNIDHADGLIDDLEYERRRAKILYKEQELELDLIRIDFDHGLIKEQERDKRIATAKGESWVGGPLNYDGEGGAMFDLDWNDFWIAELRENGYVGETDDEIMKKWFAALCYAEVINEKGQDQDPFFYEVARSELNTLINRKD
jgi:hypothetical protein